MNKKHLARKSLAISVLAIFAVFLIASTVVQAAAPKITLSPSSGPVGTSVLVTGTGFSHNEYVTINFERASRIHPWRSRSPRRMFRSCTGLQTQKPPQPTPKHPHLKTAATFSILHLTIKDTVNKFIFSYLNQKWVFGQACFSST